MATTFSSDAMIVCGCSTLKDVILKSMAETVTSSLMCLRGGGYQKTVML